MNDDGVAITPLTDLDSETVLAEVLALNNAHAVELSVLDGQGLRRLLHQAFAARRIGAVEAFLISLDEGADYAGVNFQWFRERYQRFVYVDRIVVAPNARGRGHARRLYDDLIKSAKGAGHDLIVCEVNADPPNLGSDAFHASFGFEPVGAASIHHGAKTVRYLSLALGEGG